MTGKETQFITEAVGMAKISGNGMFTKKCQSFFEEKYDFKKTLLTTSCTDALEMSAILLNIQQGDEVIVPSYTFVSTANAFVLRGAKIVFADSKPNHPNIDEEKLASLITEKTKAIVVVHYAGVACEMDTIMALAKKHNIFVIEDAAQAVDSYYKDQPLGGIGHLGTFSFHETKNIQCGEGGMLVINDDRFIERSEIIWEKGTNRAAFFRGEIDKYGWVDIGSSFLPSDITAAFLWAQLESLAAIQKQRKPVWNTYYERLQNLTKFGVKLPQIPDYATNNAHMFYLVCNSLEERSDLIHFLKQRNIFSVFHYLSLHQSNFYQNKHDGRDLKNSDYYTSRLLRLPLFFELTDENLDLVIEGIFAFYEERVAEK